MMKYFRRAFTGSIRRRAMLLAFLPAVLIASALAFYYSVTGMADLDEELRRRGITVVQYLGPASEYGVISGNRPSLQAQAQAAMQQPDVRAVVIADAKDRVLAISGRPLLAVPGIEHVGDGASLSGQGRGFLGFTAPIRRNQLEIDDFLGLDSAPADHAATERIGFVYVEFSSEEFQARKNQLLLHTLLILALGLGAGGMVALRMARSLSRPVGRLVDAVGRMAAGELDARVDQSSVGELGELERGFNHMAGRLQNMHDTMQERITTATAQLAHQASHDSLTGLMNRREFENQIRAVLAERSGEAPYHVLCFIDLDRFKIVNDTCGHAAGDELLRQITQLLRQRVRGQDLLARLGGDEFGLLLERCRLEDGTRVVESLRQLVSDFRFVWNSRAFSVGASIGLVELDARFRTLEEALSAADQACFAAKDLGRNRIHIFQADDRDVARHFDEMDWATRLNQALEEKRFLLYVQPVVPLATGSPSGRRFEVFLRLLNERGEVVCPETFLPAAERFNLMPALDRWVIDAACAGVRRLL
ncbi:MAG TPA: diguanylate cyclase, partial [Azospira sp.]|nr:diguanylate cyclase [Azospira sp.]